MIFLEKKYVNYTLLKLRLLYIKEHYQQSKNTAHRMGENICKSFL
jgi:hypothetical protein